MEIVSDYPINIDVIKTAEVILQNYEKIASYDINKNSTQLFLKDKENEVCRFCGKTFPEVKFSNCSHTISNFTGNSKLFSMYECDSCNLYFSKFENEMANFMLPNHVVFGVKGKKNKIPKYKQSGKPTINADSNNISIEELEPLAANVFSNDKAEVPIDIPTFIPDSVYRCLIKMALSILPESGLVNYYETIRWLMNEELRNPTKQYVIFSLYPSTKKMMNIRCMFFEKKECASKDMISNMFFISYGNFVFQTYLPFSKKEILGKGIKAFPFLIPSVIDLDERNKGLRQNNRIDLSSKEKDRDCKLNLKIKTLPD